MLIPNHPADERLSALASRDPDAVTDADLTTHVATCLRCTGVVDELSGLRVALAELPDLAPDRPLRLLPPVDAASEPADRLGGWVRRFFAPVLASGAAAALVGLIGTTGLVGAPGQASGPSGDSAAAPFQESAASADTLVEPEEGGDGGGAAGGAPAPGASEPFEPVSGAAAQETNRVATPFAGDDDGRTGPSPLEAQRSPWPMVLFAGVAIMVGALLLRWIVVPRAG